MLLPIGTYQSATGSADKRAVALIVKETAMATAEQQAQKLKADQLRGLIQELISGESRAASSTPESPREFVRRKMKEAESATTQGGQLEIEESCAVTNQKK